VFVWRGTAEGTEVECLLFGSRGGISVCITLNDPGVASVPSEGEEGI